MARDIDVGFTVFANTQPAVQPMVKLNRVVKQTDREMLRFGKNLKRRAIEQQRAFAAAIRGTTIALAGLAVALAKTAKTAGTYDRQIRIAAILTKNTGEQFAALDAEVKQISSDLATLPVQVAKAAQAVGRLGFRGAEAINVLRQSVTLAAASVGLLSSEGAAAAVAGALRAFGKTGEDAAITADALTNAVNNSRLAWDKLPLAIGTASGFAAAFGANLNEMLAITGGVQDILGRTERSATGVRNIFRDLAMASTQAKLAQAGLTLEVSDGAGKFRDIISILDDLFKQTAKMNQVQRQQTLQTAFSAEAAAALFSLQQRLASGFEDVNGKTVTGIAGLRAFAKFMGTTGSTVALAEEKLKGFAGAMDKFKTESALFAIEVGKALNTVLAPALNFITGLITKLKESIANASPVTKTIIGLVGAAAVVVGLAGAALLAASLAMGGWAFITGIATKANFAFLASLGPIALGIGVIVGLVIVFAKQLKFLFAQLLRFRRFIGFGGPEAEEAQRIAELEGRVPPEPEEGGAAEGPVPTGVRAIQAQAIPLDVQRQARGGRPATEGLERFIPGGAGGAAAAATREERTGAGPAVTDTTTVVLEMDSKKMGEAIIERRRREARRTFRRMGQ